MFQSETMAEAVGAGAVAFRLDDGVGRIGPAARRPAGPTGAEAPGGPHDREALRRRLLEMILRKEQLRRVRPR